VSFGNGLAKAVRSDAAIDSNRKFEWDREPTNFCGRSTSSIVFLPESSKLHGPELPSL
jgi:hypothetical protein